MTSTRVDALTREELLALVERDELHSLTLDDALALLRRLAREAEALMLDAAERAAVRGHGREVPS